MQLSDVVLSVVNDFIAGSTLFTALDVSNKVKDSLPFARHREVRDLVRDLFVSVIEPGNYARTPIKVTLDNGDLVEALLYHPLSDSWDLDAKYDDQKRKQTSLKPAQNVAAPPSFAKSNPVQVSPAPPSNPVAAPVPVAPVPVSVNAQWHQLFGTSPSLFPTR